MVRPLTDREIIERVVEIVKKHLPDCRLYLFGSRAKGTAKETSDLDFAVECEGRAPFYRMVKEAHTSFEKLILSLKRELHKLNGE